MNEIIYYTICDGNTTSIRNYKYSKNDKVVVYIKYDDAYEMFMSGDDAVLSVEIYDGVICSSKITNITIEEVIADILTEDKYAEICSREEFINAYNKTIENIKNIVGC